MAELDLSYHIDLYTGLHIGTGVGFAKMVDDTVCRAGPAKGSGVRLPCIPGSSVKGKVKSRCEALANRMDIRICQDRKCKHDLCLICRLFGSPYTPGGLYFSDAVLIQEWQNIAKPHNGQTVQNPFELSIVRTGNKVERATRTVEPEFLFSHEQTADGLRFEGSIIGEVNARSQNDISTELPLEIWMLVVGMQSVDKIGGLRSRGSGRCRIRVNEINVDGQSFTYDQLITMLGQDDYLLGLSEYDKRNKSNTSFTNSSTG